MAPAVRTAIGQTHQRAGDRHEQARAKALDAGRRQLRQCEPEVVGWNPPDISILPFIYAKKTLFFALRYRCNANWMHVYLAAIKLR